MYDKNLTQDGWVIGPVPDPMASMLSDSTPSPENLGGTAGADGKASRGDHRHPRLTSSTRVTLAGDGTATVTYTRTFSAKPVISLIAHNPSGRQVVLEVTSDTLTNGLYTGCTIKGSRAQLLPTLTALLTDVVTKLSGYDVLGASASGVEVSVIAIVPSN